MALALLYESAYLRYFRSSRSCLSQGIHTKGHDSRDFANGLDVSSDVSALLSLIQAYQWLAHHYRWYNVRHTCPDLGRSPVSGKDLKYTSRFKLTHPDME